MEGQPKNRYLGADPENTFEIMGMMRSAYGKVRHGWGRLRFYASVNWVKTVYFNFRMFPFAIARKLPVFFFGRITFQKLSGRFVIDAPICTGMINFGKRFEKFSRSRGIAELDIEGTFVCKGYVLFGKDCFISVAPGATLEMGNKSGMGRTGKIICTDSITIGDNARFSFECQVMDSNFHQMIDTESGQKSPMSSPVNVGSYNFFGNRVSVMPGCVTPDYCTVASYSICAKDYSGLGKNVLIGGVPGKLIRENISRDWEGEPERIENWIS
jgi:acetyltransferase-like isoleucine patch superfamily enzyme